ncbi:bifunctional folylpolyglutamate synthase/dihydrofolate synthase [Amphibacillus cookii]|uniref:bifunctional folylpolyglutamate synthase/dihydrofolate synthase n=1 Tax=Amphibacillus cookii TaxID=767787 RepID=UPI00195E7CE0|nr:folylpolyglutamate synthase/dihydrofolate synthase family protein [Amphibacillus cookii]MBM7541798.1 dihydrofolate synthase/folylpolyglutamate synthase [Amphibacillus cookii]
MFRSVQSFEEFLDNREQIGIKPGLDRMHRLLGAVGHPEKKIKAIHVAGTNGKGSTTVYLADTLKLAGYRIGTFTSPSLTNRQAMIQLNGATISNQSYLYYANQLYHVLATLDQFNNPASNFEIIVAIAYQFFADKAEFSIIEAGMGGLEDATNCIDPLVSVITSIDYDHTRFLGETMAEIANHKAGIIKPHRPVVVGQVSEEAFQIIHDTAQKNEAKVYRFNENFQMIKQDNNFIYKDHGLTIPFRLSMKGDHQIHNAGLAIKALMLLDFFNDSLSQAVIPKALATAVIPARFEQVHFNPVVIIDGAHNLASIKAFLDTIATLYADKKKTLIFSAFSDKPIQAMIERLDNSFDQIIFTTFDHERAETAENLYKFSRHKNKKMASDWKQLLDQMIYKKETQSMTFVTGSLTFVGKVRQYFK